MKFGISFGSSSSLASAGSGLHAITYANQEGIRESGEGVYSLCPLSRSRLDIDDIATHLDPSKLLFGNGWRFSLDGDFSLLRKDSPL